MPSVCVVSLKWELTAKILATYLPTRRRQKLLLYCSTKQIGLPSASALLPNENSFTLRNRLPAIDLQWTSYKQGLPRFTNAFLVGTTRLIRIVVDVAKLSTCFDNISYLHYSYLHLVLFIKKETFL